MIQYEIASSSRQKTSPLLAMTISSTSVPLIIASAPLSAKQSNHPARRDPLSFRTKGYRREDGFTIQELLVVLIVSSLLVTFSLSLFLFAGKLFSSWQRHSSARRSADGALQAIAYDFQRSSCVTVVPDSISLIDLGEGRVVEYRFTADSVLRNGVSMVATDGEQLFGKILDGSGQESPDDGSRLYHVELEGRFNGTEYAAECDLVAPRSSLGSFAGTDLQARK